VICQKKLQEHFQSRPKVGISVFPWGMVVVGGVLMATSPSRGFTNRPLKFQRLGGHFPTPGLQREGSREEEKANLDPLTGIQETSKLVWMKATIELPDDLYRRVKAKSAMEGRAIRDVTAELYRQWLAESEPSPSPVGGEAWLEDWLATGREEMDAAPSRPTAREILTESRSRIEPPAK
jgi:plasmid stability protein